MTTPPKDAPVTEAGRLRTAVSILLRVVDTVMPEHSPYGCPHSRDWLNGVLDDVRVAYEAEAATAARSDEIDGLTHRAATKVALIGHGWDEADGIALSNRIVREYARLRSEQGERTHD
jgi:hypothetical protein